MSKTNINPEVVRVAMEKLGTYLKGIRKHRGLSIAQLAKKTGIDEEDLEALEEGIEQDPPLDMGEFFAITNALDCYFYLADRGGKHLDGDDLITKMKDPI